MDATSETARCVCPTAQTNLSLSSRHLALWPAAGFVGLDRIGDGGELALFLGSISAALEGIRALHEHAMHVVGFAENRMLGHRCWQRHWRHPHAALVPVLERFNLPNRRDPLLVNVDHVAAPRY